MNPLVSVVIPSYNSAHFVVDAIESVLAQTYPRVEVIVVDNDSQDNTPEVIAPYEDRVRYIRQDNRGLSGSRNRGIEESRGELLAFLDADDKWLPDKLARQCEVLSANPDVGLVHTDVLCWQSDEDHVFHRPRNREIYSGHCYEALFWGNAVLPSTVVVRRECIDEVGDFDRNITRNSTQDYDLWLRIARSFAFAYIGEPLVHYRLHDENASARTLILREDELYTVDKALRDDPSLTDLIGDHNVRRRLFDLCFDVGYLHFDGGDVATAHRYFGRALQQQGLKPHAISLWLATLFPPRIVQGARRLKQMFSFHHQQPSAT